MALFKVFRTQQGELPPAIRDGFCYYVESENKFYIDAYGSRKVLNDFPDELADLISDDTHRTVTDEQIAAWTEIAGIQPATPTTDGLMSAADKEKLDGIETGAEVNVQSDWTQTTTTADDYIRNKPILGTASSKDVAEIGDASAL